MTIHLRDYQTELVQQTGAALRRVKSVLLQAPPGAGKTAIATFIADSFLRNQRGVWFLCHRAELIEQTSKTFSKFGLPHSHIAAGYPFSPAELVHVCSIDTLKNRLGTLRVPRIALVDEAHHGGAAGWALVIQWLIDNGAQVIGLSGTPQRHDGAGLDKHFDELILGPAVAWLIENGFLSEYRIFAPSAPDMQGVRKLMGDFNKKDTAERMDKPKLTGDMITHWHKHARGLLTVGYGVNIAHSQHLAEQFKAAGVRAVHLDGMTKRAERRAMINDFGPGGIEVIFNVGLFGEGFDLSAIAQRDITIDAVIDAAPTMSLSWYLQKIMRCMRPAPNKTGIILDHAGNSNRHGFPDDERDWTLEGKNGGKKAANDNAPPPPVTCEGCFQQIRRPVPTNCPYCDKLMKAEVKPIEVAEGELKEQTEADKRATRARLKQEERDCKTLGDWTRLEKERNYKKGWGFIKYRQEEAKRLMRRAG